MASRAWGLFAAPFLLIAGTCRGAAPVPPPTPGQESIEKRPPSARRFGEQEFKQVYVRFAFPAVKAAVEAYGLKLTRPSCNIAAGFSLTAFKLLGAEGVAVRQGRNHVFNEAPASGGKTLLFDASAAQFYKDGSPTGQALSEVGFIGTEDELRQLINDQVQDWDFEMGVKGGGPHYSTIEEDMAGARKWTLEHDHREMTDAEFADAKETSRSEHVKIALDTYFGKASPELKLAADDQDRWYWDSSPDRRYFNIIDKSDQTEKMRASYDVLDKTLQAAIPVADAH